MSSMSHMTMHSKACASYRPMQSTTLQQREQRGSDRDYSEVIFTKTGTTTSPNISYHLAVKNAWKLSINMPWPAMIAKLFNLAKSGREMDESEFYGPFNAVLNYLFPYEEDYEIVPQYKRPQQSKSVGFTTIFIVRHDKHPVFFVFKPHSAEVNSPRSRSADEGTV